MIVPNEYKLRYVMIELCQHPIVGASEEPPKVVI